MPQINAGHRPILGMSLMALAFLYLPVMDGIAKYLSQALPIGEIVLARFTLQCCFLLPFMLHLGLPLWPKQAAGLQFLRGIMMMLTTVFFWWIALYADC